MQQNLGTADRVLRGVAAVLIAVFFLLGLLGGVWAVVLGLLAVCFLTTAILGFCPLYVPFGLRTLD